jgi:hypothetical protein
MTTKQSTLTFITESLPGFQVGVPASVQIEASGGTPSYSFQITQGMLPKNLRLNETGMITGVPEGAGDTTVFVKVTDNAGATLTQAFDVQVSEP